MLEIVSEPLTAGAVLADTYRLVKREGKECLADLDTFDNMPDRPVPKSMDLDSGYGSIRATCMMLVGDCEAGKKHYRAWIPLHSTPMEPALYDFAADAIMKQFCQPKP